MKSGKLLESSMFAQWSHSAMDVLSPRLRKHSSLFDSPFFMACHMEMMEARNSRQLIG
jgi:hypothetical protein